MIEKKFVADNLREFKIQEFITETVKKVGHSHTKLIKTPLGEKIIIYTSRPGLVVGRKGQNIKKITTALKKKFHLENPQVEISEVERPFLDAQIVAENIANSLERFGLSRFKGVGHKMMAEVMNSGARGIEIVISGKIPSSRARRWRFYQGYLKKCGDIAVSGVNKAYSTAELKTGTVGIIVKIMPPDIRLPDDVKIRAEMVKETEVKAEKEGKKKEEAETEEKPAEPAAEEVKEEKNKSKKAPKKVEKKEVKEEPAEEKKESKAKETKPKKKAVAKKKE